jgi:hypothetical protein
MPSSAGSRMTRAYQQAAPRVKPGVEMTPTMLRGEACGGVVRRPFAAVHSFSMAPYPDLAFESTRRLTREEFAEWIADRPPSDCNHYELLQGSGHDASGRLPAWPAACTRAALPPAEAAAVVRQMRSRLRRKRAVPAEREMKQRHYASWMDEPIPALSGESPREAARTAAGRARLDVLLKDLENRESRLPEPERFDVAGLRSALGLEG